jgi:serine/threonine protein kinase/class 3 adenylate cyclase
MTSGPVTTRPDLSLLDTDLTTQRQPGARTILCLEVTDATVLVDRRRASDPTESVQYPAEIAAECVRNHYGSVTTVVPGMIMAEFPDSGSAVRTAMEIQRQLIGSGEPTSRNSSLELRVGIYAARSEKGTLLDGDATTAVTKISKRAGPGQILISRAVYEAVSQDSDLQCQWVSSFKSKSDEAPEDVFEVNYSEVPACVPPRYEVLSRVGTGGMGIVYKVRDLEAREIIALKILKPGASADQGMQENLRREVYLARKVTHKNVCRIHEFNRSKGTAYISMEFIEGESLLRRLRRTGGLPLEESLGIVRQICAGLREAHLQGIVHRDLKPANIMIDSGGNVKIMDFGIARLAQDNGQMTGTVAGTPAYMAPEQVQLKPLGPRTDIYSVGLLLYEFVTGTQAFTGDNSIAIALKQINDSPRRPREIVPDLPQRIEAVILKALEKDPAKRFESVDALLAAVESPAPQANPLSIAAAIGPDLRRAATEISHVVHLGVEKARPAVPVIAKFARDAQHAAVRATVAARVQTRKTARKVSTFDWNSLKRSRSGQAVTASLLSGFLLVGVVAVARGSRTGYANNSVPAAFATTSTQSPNVVPPAGITIGETADPRPADTISPSPEPSTNVGTEPVDLSQGFGVATAAAPAPDPSAANGAVKSDAPGSSATNSKPASSGMKSGTAPASATAKKSHPKSTLNQRLAVDSTSAPVPNFDATRSSNPAATSPGSSPLSSNALPQPSSVAPPAAANNEHPSDSASVAPPLWEPFLDVATFKDQARADEAIDKLTKAGFHAFSVQKTHFFIGSYHVEVGPFDTQHDIGAAQQQLAALGYKSHTVK